MTESALTTSPESSVYKNESSFELHQRMAKSLAQSTLVPAQYQGQQGFSNCLVALETANRMNMSPLVVMQNLNIIKGKPSWSAQFVIAVITGCGRFDDFDYEITGEGDSLSCRCVAVRKKDKKTIYGSSVSLKMAKSEGWTSNRKWLSMPEHMLRFRAATFFGRQHVADLLLGVQTEDEIIDIQPVDVTPETKEEKKKKVPTRNINLKIPNTPHEAAISIPQEEPDDFGF